jgi:fumarate reductase iron-sulfur subunit|tara:strand:- start:18142 stop:18933 length:792 start_codon:yes stop_codon:yes gene_type:complete
MLIKLDWAMTIRNFVESKDDDGDAKPIGEIKVSIWRGGDHGTLQTFAVPHYESQTVLDVVTWVQHKLDPGLSYRFSCRVGMCGTCAMTVNGQPRWTCRTHVSRVVSNGELEIRPLRNLPVIKDLVVDMAPFFDKWHDGHGYFEPSQPGAQTVARVDGGSPARKHASAAIECIGCAVCYAACDVVAWQSEYLGPAALNRAWTLVNDERDNDRMGHLAAVAVAGGCHGCHSMGSCASHCPNSLNPTASIAGLKREVTKAILKGEL